MAQSLDAAVISAPETTQLPFRLPMSSLQFPLLCRLYVYCPGSHPGSCNPQHGEDPSDQGRGGGGGVAEGNQRASWDFRLMLLLLVEHRGGADSVINGLKLFLEHRGLPCSPACMWRRGALAVFSINLSHGSIYPLMAAVPGKCSVCMQTRGWRRSTGRGEPGPGEPTCPLAPRISPGSWRMSKTSTCGTHG